MPAGLFTYARGGAASVPREASRLVHGALMAGGATLMFLGYGAAWWIHHSKGHAHLPRLPPASPLVKSLHVYGGLLVLAAVAAQAAAGALKVANSGSRIFTWHGAVGPGVWVGAAAVASAGVYIPFIHKGGNPAIGGALLAASAAAAALVLAALLTNAAGTISAAKSSTAGTGLSGGAGKGTAAGFSGL